MNENPLKILFLASEVAPFAKTGGLADVVGALPKTRSGKIMRRLLRSLAKGEEITQDTSTLENPTILTQLGKAH